MPSERRSIREQIKTFTLMTPTPSVSGRGQKRPGHRAAAESRRPWQIVSGLVDWMKLQAKTASWERLTCHRFSIPSCPQGCLLRKLLDKDDVPNMILWGPVR